MTLDNIDRDTHELLGERPKAGHASPSAVLSTFSRRERGAEGGGCGFPRVTEGMIKYPRLLQLSDEYPLGAWG